MYKEFRSFLTKSANGFKGSEIDKFLIRKLMEN